MKGRCREAGEKRLKTRARQQGNEEHTGAVEGPATVISTVTELSRKERAEISGEGKHCPIQGPEALRSQEGRLTTCPDGEK